MAYFVFRGKYYLDNIRTHQIFPHQMSPNVSWCANWLQHSGRCPDFWDLTCRNNCQNLHQDTGSKCAMAEHISCCWLLVKWKCVPPVEQYIFTYNYVFGWLGLSARPPVHWHWKHEWSSMASCCRVDIELLGTLCSALRFLWTQPVIWSQ